MAYESPAVAVYGYPTQLTPEQVLGTNLAPLQHAADVAGERQTAMNQLLLGAAFNREAQMRDLQARTRIQSMRDQMMYDRLQGMENAKIQAVRQAGINKNITDALNSAQDAGITAPARQAGMTDDQYLDAINQAVGSARVNDIKNSTAAVKNALKKMDQLAGQKRQMEAEVEPDAQKIAMAKIGNLQQWVQGQSDPDLLNAYNAAAKAGQPVPAQVAQAYSDYAQGVYTATKYDLISKSTKGKQYDAIGAELNLQGQLIHNALYSADRSGRVAPKPYASQIENDATTQYYQDYAKAANDAATKAAGTKDPADGQKAATAAAAAQRAAVVASSVQQKLQQARGAWTPPTPEAAAAAKAQGTGVLGAGWNWLDRNTTIPATVRNAGNPPPQSGPVVNPSDIITLGDIVRGIGRGVGNVGTSGLLAKDFLLGTSGAPLPLPARAAVPPTAVVRAPMVQTNMAMAVAPSPVNVLQLPQVAAQFQGAAQAPVAAPGMTPDMFGIGALQAIDPASMVQNARYAQMMNTSQ